MRGPALSSWLGNAALSFSREPDTDTTGRSLGSEGAYKRFNGLGWNRDEVGLLAETSESDSPEMLGSGILRLLTISAIDYLV